MNASIPGARNFHSLCSHACSGTQHELIRFVVSTLAILCVMLSAHNSVNAHERGSAISQLLREELDNIEQQAGGETANEREFSAWKKGIEEVLQLWRQCQYHDAVRLSTNLVPLGYGSEATSIQRCNRFVVLLRCALMYEAGESASAELPLQGILADESPAFDSTQQVIARRLLAKVLIDCAKFEAALAELDEALRTSIGSGNATEVELFPIMVDRVRVLTYMGRLVEARQLINEIGPQAKNFEEKAPAVHAEYLVVCGFLAYEEDEYSKAVDFMANAAERHARISGTASRDSIEALINLGLAEAAVHRPNDADRHIREAMEQIEKTFGQRHRFHSRALFALACQSIQAEKFREAYNYAKEARNVSSPNAYDTAAILETTADSLFFAQDPEGSRNCYQEATTRYAESGAQLRSVWASCNLARSHFQRHEYEQALTLYGPLLRDAKCAKLIAGDHPRYVREVYYMACSLRNLGHFADAERILTALMERETVRKRFADQELAWIQIELGLCQVRLKKYEAAESSLERASELIRGEDALANTQRSFVAAYLAECHLATEQFDRAKEEAARANQLIREAHGEHSPLYAMYGLRPAAHLALKMRDYDTAEALLAKSTSIIEATLGNDAYELVATLTDHAFALRGLGQIDRADDAAARAERIRLRFSQSEAANSLTK